MSVEGDDVQNTNGVGEMSVTSCHGGKRNKLSCSMSLKKFAIEKQPKYQ